MVDVSDKEIHEAYNDLRDDNTPTNWILVGYDPENKSKAKLFGKGEGGYDEFTQTLDQNQDLVLYGVLRCFGVDEDSKRTKFIMVTWVGPEVKPMLRARVSTHKSTFINLFKGHHISVHASSLKELQKEDLEEKLQSSTGAHKPKSYEW